MGTVTKRDGDEITIATFEEADEVAGRRLDRRGRYHICPAGDYGLFVFPVDTVTRYAEWPRECTGCEGAGCRECGGHGRVREGMFLPLEAFVGEE